MRLHRRLGRQLDGLPVVVGAEDGAALGDAEARRRAVRAAGAALALALHLGAVVAARLRQ